MLRATFEIGRKYASHIRRDGAWKAWRANASLLDYPDSVAALMVQG